MKPIIVPVKSIEQYIYTKPIKNIPDYNSFPAEHIYTSHKKNQCDSGIIKVSIKPKNTISVKIVGVSYGVDYGLQDKIQFATNLDIDKLFK